MSNDQKVRLDLGCGKKKRAGSIGVDWSDRHDAGVVYDLSHFYPLDDISFYLRNPIL